MAMREERMRAVKQEHPEGRQNVAADSYCREYLSLCTGQMRCKAMRPVVEKELYSHIEDQKQAYLEEGMDEAEAQELAVKQMGDPVETGTALDRIHRPKMNWKAVGMILLLSALGALIQYAFGRENGDMAEFYRFIKSTALGILLMFGVCCVDYTIIGKYPREIWCLMVGLVVAATFLTPVVHGMRRTEYLVMLMVPCYAGLVFYYREQRIKGIIKAMAWLFLTGAIFLPFGPTPVIGKIWLCCGFLMLGYAVLAGWYHVSRAAVGIVWGVPAAGVIAMLVWLLNGSGYRRDRILSFLYAGSDLNGMGYWYNELRKSLAEMKLVGKSPAVHPAEWFYRLEDGAFLFIGEYYGLLAGVVLVTAMLVFLGILAYRLSRQGNRLGTLTGIGCICLLAVSVLFHTLISIGYLPNTACALPLISMNGKQNVCMFIVLGLLLSVFRGRNTRPEPEVSTSRPRWRFIMNGQFFGYKRES